ncbi:M23 family metallopeptidase [Mariniflexile jejuense]|uniref:M23 family metallopeptidase n=1 Tax=Mariniflexile jejuense TaxID=1173582 RepID=A0ABW3JIL7_9FLAO
MGIAQDYSEAGDDWGVDDWISWAEDNDIDYDVFTDPNDYIYDVNNDDDVTNDVYDWNDDGVIDVYDAAIQTNYGQNFDEMVIIGSSSNSDDECISCACDPYYCPPVTDPDPEEETCPSGDACECFGIGCMDYNNCENDSDGDGINNCIDDCFGVKDNCGVCGGDGSSCVNDKPCKGDPVKNPEVAAQKNSGINGGKFGYTRSGGKQFHGGLDIKNSYGSPVYAMFDGHAQATALIPKAGYVVYQTAIVNGENISIQYFHLQENNRVTGDVKAGDIIGYQGDSGNLGNAISQGLSVSHVHIKIKNSSGTALNPENYLATKFDSSGKPINNCN